MRDPRIGIRLGRTHAHDRCVALERHGTQLIEEGTPMTCMRPTSRRHSGHMEKMRRHDGCERLRLTSAEQLIKLAMSGWCLIAIISKLERIANFLVRKPHP